MSPTMYSFLPLHPLLTIPPFLGPSNNTPVSAGSSYKRDYITPYHQQKVKMLGPQRNPGQVSCSTCGSSQHFTLGWLPTPNLSLLGACLHFLYSNFWSLYSPAIFAHVLLVSCLLAGSAPGSLLVHLPLSHLFSLLYGQFSLLAMFSVDSSGYLCLSYNK